ncbi:ABC transporter ATP-binding protein [Actinomadura sp. WAC 06369]|uniref:ABC transporter ATP-binding protein n=1 Tax=Actinomadura sp. WAC 06369 TaxID=2203193 RepID=UPI000F7A4613|nr:ABC transporter ATP-binding protein [Actinomadura sp. WAC 06369]RSN71325.1 multidrug ABC transporter permease [Actinomadura sp. WAC 06369]
MTGRLRRLRAEFRDAPAALLLAVRAAPAHVALCVAAGLVAGGTPVVVAWLTKTLLDRMAARAPDGLSSLLAAAVALAAVGVVAAVLPHVSEYASAEVGRRLKLTTQDRLFAKVGGMPGLARLEDPAFHERLMLAQQSGNDSPARVLGGVIQLVQATLTLGGFLGTLFVLAPLMAAVVLAAVLPVLVAERALNHRRALLFRRLGPAERRELFYAHLLRDLQAAKEVRVFGVADHLRGKMLSELTAINTARRRLDLKALGVQGVLALLSASVAGGGLVWAAGAIENGRLGIGDVAVFIAAVSGTQGALANAVRSLSTAHEALLVFGHYRAVIETPPDLQVAERVRPVPPLRRGIELRDVWFRYGEDRPWALRGVDLVIPAGRTLALVGHNGAGKSTLVKLLCRLYDPTAGTVRWDGIDVREFDPAEFRARLSTVFQDYMCYDLSVRENIGIGDLSARHDQARLERAARRAGVHDRLTELPRGYDTLLSRMFPDSEMDEDAGGVLLSGGQWQRLAVARSFLREAPDLLILDEPSSGLDAEAEYELHMRLKGYRAGRTGVLVSHRLGALRDADSIAVFQDGRITERGAHADLMARDGAYARMFRLQAQGYLKKTPTA